MTEKTLYIVDGHALAYRAYFALLNSGLSTRSGEPTFAVQGFYNMIFRLLEQDRPDYLAFSFDVGRTFRDDISPDYKGTREKMPDDLEHQIGRIQQVAEALNIPIYTAENYEADDVIGSIAGMAAAEGVQVVIVTGDRDLLQLVTPQVKVSLPAGRGIDESKLYGPAEVEERFGVRPDQFVDFKALVGDSSDNIPGVAGIGEKTAASLLQTYTTLDNIYAHLDDIKGANQKKLREGAESARLSYTLSKIITDLDINFDLNACRAPSLTEWPPNFDREKVADLFRELQFNSLLRKLPTPPLPADPDATTGQLSLFDMGTPAPATRAGLSATAIGEVTLVIDEAGLAACIAALQAAPLIAFDTETTSTDQMSAELVGISLAVRPGHGYYIPVGHQPQAAPNGQLPLETVLDALRGPLTDPAIPKVAHNAKYDYVVLHRYGLTVTPITVDTMLAVWLRNPDSRELGLKRLANNRLRIEMTDIEDLIGKGKGQTTFDTVPVEIAANYAAADADVTLRLLPEVQAGISEVQAEKLLVDIEMPLIPVLARMEMAGIMIDVEFLQGLGLELEKAMDALERDIYRMVGYQFNLASTQQLAQALYADLNLVPPKGTTRTKAGLYSTAAYVLEEMAEQHEVVRKILEHRELSKLKSTYVDALPGYVNPRTGRIHTSYAQHGTVTGRISSSDPNLQNIPIRTELGRQVRKAIIAPLGFKLVGIDYSQIELRVVAHIANDAFMIDAFKNDQDIHAATAAAVFNVPLDQVTREQRRNAKAVNFGLIYGMGPYRLAQSTGITLGEAEQFIETYFARIPGIRRYLDDTREQMRTLGYVETLLGRRRYFEGYAIANPQEQARAQREAVNAPIQGSAADIMKLAMLKLDSVLVTEFPEVRMSLQVHDELVFECPDSLLPAFIPRARDIMQTVYPLRVPLKVEVKVGQNWYDMEAQAPT